MPCIQRQQKAQRQGYNSNKLGRSLALTVLLLISTWGCNEYVSFGDLSGTPGNIAYCGSEHGVSGFTGENALVGHDAGLNIVWPTTGTAPYPVVIFVPGVHHDLINYIIDGDVDYFDPIVQDYADAGMVAISINYRQDNIVEMYEDVACAVRWVKAHAQTNVPMYSQADPAGPAIVDAQRVEMDPNKIVLVGHSLGGYPVHLVGAEMEKTDFTNHEGFHSGYNFTAVSDMYSEETLETAAVATVNAFGDILAAMSGIQWGALYNPLFPSGPTHVLNPVNSSVVLGPYCSNEYLVPLAPYALNYLFIKSWLLAGMGNEDFLSCDQDDNLVLDTTKLKYVDMLNIQRLYNYPAQSQILNFNKPYLTLAGVGDWVIPSHNAAVTNVHLLLLPERNPIFTNTVSELIILEEEFGGVHELVESEEMQAALFDFVAPSAGLPAASLPSSSTGDSLSENDLFENNVSQNSPTAVPAGQDIGEPVADFCAAFFDDITDDTNYAADNWDKCVQLDSLASIYRLEIPEPPSIPAALIKDREEENNKPTWVNPHPGEPVYPSYLALGRDFACRIDRELQCWGEDRGGNDQQSILTPLMERWTPDSQVYVGGTSICMVDAAGVVSCWGNFKGQNATQNLRQLTVTDNYACAIRNENNALQCWGNPPSLSTISQVRNPVELSAGVNHLCLIDYEGRIFCDSDLAAPSFGPRVFATQITSGLNHACAVIKDEATQDSNFYQDKTVCWDANGSSFAPQLDHPTEIAAGDNHTCAIDQGGVQCWGDNSVGQLNVPNMLNYRLPNNEEARPGVVKASGLVAAGNNTCVMVKNRRVICWGDPSTGINSIPPNIGNSPGNPN